MLRQVQSACARGDCMKAPATGRHTRKMLP
ncbi:hypothetical protein D7V97_00390 [Corallococcus sp. CA053C]|nr:hypothetical protein D7V97_00390 [Corallococcus sp. CA053C]